MPLYDYVCGDCGVRTEVMHGVHASGPEACPSCSGGPMKKALTAPAVHFKGTGWAKKERASSSGTKAASRANEPSNGGDSAGEGSGHSTPEAASASNASGDSASVAASSGSTSPGSASSGSSSAGSSSAGSSSARSGAGEG